jgi:antitoxin (DNA-binding transcriptional repressor) of toxin-antitoxin stability system
MARLDLDDLPPRVAALLTDLPAGEELLLVQHGAVVGRLIAPDAPEPEEAPEDDAVEPDQKLREVFETFRSSIEDEF